MLKILYNLIECRIITVVVLTLGNAQLDKLIPVLLTLNVLLQLEVD